LRIALYCSVWRNYGGWSTYVKHISQGFADCLGVEVAVVVGSGKERPRLEWRDRLAFAGLGYLDVADIILIAVPPLTMEGCIGLARRDRAPTVMVLHDPTEWHKKDSRQVLDLVRPQLFYFVGERDRHTFIREMGYRAEMVVHKHPYHRIGGGSDVTRTNRVVATSRIDWDKNTHLIVAAKRGVELWAGYIDWRYNYEKFGGAISKHPDYRGKFGVDDESIHRVYEGACALVDLSAISLSAVWKVCRKPLIGFVPAVILIGKHRKRY